MSVGDRDAIGLITLVMTLGITTKVWPTKDVSSNALRIVQGTKTVEHSNGQLISRIMFTIVAGGRTENVKLNLNIHCTTHDSCRAKRSVT